MQHLGEVPDVIDHAPTRFPAGQDHVLHPIALAEGSRVALAMDATEVIGASFHHQGLDRIGNGLKVVGHSPDGVIEALEHADRWLIGVQWHPEDTAPTDQHQQALYDVLVAQARATRLVG